MRGLEIGIHLRPGLHDENFVAVALANLAAYRLEGARGERLEWQILRVEGSPGQHHFRLVLRHPDRALDLGLQRNLAEILQELSRLTTVDLAHALAEAKTQGLEPVALRHVHEAVDYWRDDFWNWLG